MDSGNSVAEDVLCSVRKSQLNGPVDYNLKLKCDPEQG